MWNTRREKARGEHGDYRLVHVVKWQNVSLGVLVQKLVVNIYIYIYKYIFIYLALVVYKANREHLLESGGRPVCRTVAHQSLDDLILSLSNS